MASFVVKVRQYDGFFDARFAGGVRRGIRWGKWRSVSKSTTLEDAVQEYTKQHPEEGLKQVAVFHKGKKVYPT